MKLEREVQHPKLSADNGHAGIERPAARV